MTKALTDPSYAALLDRIDDPGFSWDAAADRLVEVYERLRDRPRRRSRCDRRRLALVTLLPPTPSGIADHSERLATALAVDVDDVDVTVFVPEIPSEQLGRPYEVARLATLPAVWERGDVDAVLYCFGNNRWHNEFYDMMQVVPGAAFLHDVLLIGMYDPFTLDRMVGTIYTTATERRQPLLARPVVRLATTVLVQSGHAAELVRRDALVDAIDVGPHPCAEVVDPASETAQVVDDGAPWVVTLGIADATKASDLFVDAARLLHDRRDVRTAMVGLGGEAFVDDDDPIVMTGRVDDDEFTHWLRRAAVVVQLRRRTNGESSGVVAHALANGIPLVVSDLGAMAELPDDVAVRVPADATASELADAIEALLDDPARRAAMSAAGRAFAARETPLAQARRITAALFDD